MPFREFMTSLNSTRILNSWLAISVLIPPTKQVQVVWPSLHHNLPPNTQDECLVSVLSLSFGHCYHHHFGLSFGNPTFSI